MIFSKGLTEDASYRKVKDFSRLPHGRDPLGPRSGAGMEGPRQLAAKQHVFYVLLASSAVSLPPARQGIFMDQQALVAGENAARILHYFDMIRSLCLKGKNN
ncbi:hypothetical protein [Desulfovibrio piger]|uniref:hypothetical protein n=1 Tax=Desulfovibrio piger TaxID=901 RepID=UPI00307783A2